MSKSVLSFGVRINSSRCVIFNGEDNLVILFSIRYAFFVMENSF